MKVRLSYIEKFLKLRKKLSECNLEAEIELEKQRSISEEAHKIKQLGAETVEPKAELQNEKGGHESLKERREDCEGGEEFESENVLTLQVNSNKAEYTSTPVMIS